MRFLRLVWDGSAKTAAVIFFIYILVAAIDFALVMWRTAQCPAIDEISTLPPPYAKVITLVESNNPSDIAQAAELVYEDRPVSDADTELGFRNLCLAEDLRRTAARLGDENSRQWLIEHYGKINFPMAGKQRYHNPCEAAEWRNYRPGDEVPAKGFSLTRYFYANSCDIPHLWDGSDRIIFEAAINCINKNKT